MSSEYIPDRKKNLSTHEAFLKIQHYCAYQERSHREVKNKLVEYGLFASEVDALMAQLIVAGFLNEERFAKAFAGGKFRVKKWGRIKIQHTLTHLGVSHQNISIGLQEIDPVEYINSLKQLIAKRKKESTEQNFFRLNNKVARYLIGKGYEPELVWECLQENE